MTNVHALKIVFLSLFLICGSNTEDPCIVTSFDQLSAAVQNCYWITIDNLKVPGGEKLQLNLNPGTTLIFKGNTSFEYYEWEGPLINLTGSHIVVKGEEGSVIDGQGAFWWDGLGSWGNITKPRLVRISVNNALLENIHIKNCPMACMKIFSSDNVIVRNWKIDVLEGDEGVAPPNKFAHNTDGIGIGQHSNNILIENSVVYNQDDCVTVTSGENITVRNMFCHGSHGLTIGGQSSSMITNVTFEDSIITMAENGIHIKTHVDALEGLISNVTYRNITILDATDYGIAIQQNYRNLPAGHPQDGPPQNNIPIHNLKFENIYGNVQNGAVPVFILCAEKGCFDWKWKDVKILGAVKDNCTNYVPDGFSC